MRRITGRLRALLQSTRGAALIMVAASMFAIAAAAAIAIDIGMLTWTRGQSQRSADAAALAGAGWLIADPYGEAGARARAKEYAWLNPVRGDSVVLLDEDIDVILDSAKVRVRVNHVASRGTAVATFFARVLGITHVDVRTMAAAWAAPADDLAPVSVDCPLPIALLDRWSDANGNGTYDEGEYYNPETTGYNDNDIGTLIVAKVSGSQSLGPEVCRTESPYVDLDACKDEPDSENWRCWYRESQETGDNPIDVLGSRIYPGDDCGPELSVGDPVWAATGSGNKQVLVHSTHEDFGASGSGSFRDLIEADSEIYWDEADGCPKRPGSDACVESSPRIRSVPLLDPVGVHGTGSGVSSTITDFTGVFVELVSCNYDLGMFGGPQGNWNVYLRLMRSGAGSGGGSGSDDFGGTTLRKLRLIE